MSLDIEARVTGGMAEPKTSWDSETEMLWVENLVTATATATAIAVLFVSSVAVLMYLA